MKLAARSLPLLLRLLSFSLLLAAAAPRLSVAQDPARLDEIVDAYAPERFMGNVLVVRSGDVFFEKSYGHANLEWNIPHTRDSKFRIGSLTKQFTAAAILLLEEQGKLKTSDLLSTHLPGTPDAWKDITIHHLLSHESGIPDIARLPWFNENITRPTTTAAMIDVFRDLPLDFTPGTEFRYSNSGYMVLSRLVELLGGGSYANFVRDNIFTPLGMASSGYDSNTQVITNRAAGYSPGPNGPVNAPFLDMSVPQGAGGLYSTTGDLRRWSEGLFGGMLLSATSLDKMITPNLGDYAYGVDVTMPDGRKRIRHNGGLQGFNTAMAYYPADKLLVVALSNLNGPTPDVLIAHLADVMHGKEVVLPSERREISLSEDILQQYVGTYPLAPNFALSVTVEDGQLITQATNQPKLPIYAESETVFFLKVVEATIEFQKDDSGTVTGLTLHQNGRSISGPKQPLVPPPPMPAEIALPAEVLARYAGNYAIAPDFILTLTVEEGQLMAQATGQPKVPVYAESEARFFYKVVAATLDFDIAADGRVTGLTLNQGGRSMPAPRQ